MTCTTRRCPSCCTSTITDCTTLLHVGGLFLQAVMDKVGNGQVLKSQSCIHSRSCALFSNRPGPVRSFHPRELTPVEPTEVAGVSSRDFPSLCSAQGPLSGGRRALRGSPSAWMVQFTGSGEHKRSPFARGLVARHSGGWHIELSSCFRTWKLLNLRPSGMVVNRSFSVGWPAVC